MTSLFCVQASWIAVSKFNTCRHGADVKREGVKYKLVCLFCVCVCVCVCACACACACAWKPFCTCSSIPVSFTSYITFGSCMVILECEFMIWKVFKVFGESFLLQLFESLFINTTLLYISTPNDSKTRLGIFIHTSELDVIKNTEVESSL